MADFYRKAVSNPERVGTVFLFDTSKDPAETI